MSAKAAVRHAIELLNRASEDWRGNGTSDVGPLHWPTAIRLPRLGLAAALEEHFTRAAPWQPGTAPGSAAIQARSTGLAEGTAGRITFRLMPGPRPQLAAQEPTYAAAALRAEAYRAAQQSR